MVVNFNLKIIVISDTHGDIESIYKVIDKHYNADLFIHAGDSCLMPFEIPLFQIVKGNCDLGYEYPEELTIKTEFGDIYVTHGHKYFNISPYLIESKNAKIFIFGHTHKKYFDKINNTYVVNPGSLVRPRDGLNGTYAIIYLDNNKCKVEFENL